MPARRKFLIYTLITAVFIGILFPFLNYAGKEGFNPSDDGVILAQSWRIIQGEVPHKDFIAMKPALSGYLHTLNFILPLALEDNARWFVVFQNFLLSFLWVFLLFRIFIPEDKNGFLFIAIAILAFTMNLNHHGLFPWTTVDGLFWTVTGCVFYFSQYKENRDSLRSVLMVAAGIFFFNLAFLSRQSFIFPLLLIDILTLVYYFRSGKYFKLLLVFIFGHLPVLIYLTYLMKNDALTLFLGQISGRTELPEVGIFQYIKSFIKSRLFLINLPVLVYAVWIIILKLRPKGTFTHSSIISKYPVLISTLSLVWLVLCLSLSVNMLIIHDAMNQANPFELFFVMLSILLFTIACIPLNAKQKALLWLGLIICWTTSLSLGSNSPVYCLGLVVSLNIILSLHILTNYSSESFKLVLKKAWILMFPFSICIFILGILMQQKINYRDRPASELQCSLGKLIPGMGRTLTNSNLCEYYSEFMKIYNEIPEIKDHFVLLPNNAMIYPVLKSNNPFPIDWAQHDEYIGQEKMVLDRIRKLLQNEKLFILIDKYNVETIADGLTAIDYFNLSSTSKEDLFLKKYKVDKYDYLSLVSQYCVEMPSDYRFFRIYVTRPMK